MTVPPVWEARMVTSWKQGVGLWKTVSHSTLPRRHLAVVWSGSPWWQPLRCLRIFVGSGIFKSENPAARARAIVLATTHYMDFDLIARVSEGIGEPMRGLDVKEIPEEQRMAVRGW